MVTAEGNILTDFCATLRELIEEKEQTIKSLATELKVSYIILLRWKNGEKNLRLNSLIKLADYFNCSIEYLCGRTKEDIIYTPQECPRFGEWIDTVIKKCGKTTYQLFKNTTIRSSQYYYWKRGSVPLLTSLDILARFLDTTLDFLVGRER